MLSKPNTPTKELQSEGEGEGEAEHVQGQVEKKGGHKDVETGL